MLDRLKKLSTKNRICFYLVECLYILSGLIISLLCIIMRVFPIQKGKIVCCNMKGKRYGDNPKYITDALLQMSGDYKIVWLLNENVDEDIPEGVVRAKYSILSMIYHLQTAQVWIDSNTKQYGIIKRNGQTYVQTWHGSYGFKKLYGDIPDKITIFDEKPVRANSKMADLMVANSRRTSEIYRSAFWYKGEILECGSPRNDLMYVDQTPIRKKVDEYFGTYGKKLALYAPTYRNGFGTEAFSIDYDTLREALSKRYGGDWCVLVRLHPHNSSDAKNFIKYNDDVVNATNYSVMQELLVASDVLISDYSSCILDFVTRGKPCFLYATDIDKYKEEQGWYFDMTALPFPIAKNNDELSEKIINFDEQVYTENLNKLFDMVGLRESGNASVEVAKWIIKRIG